MNLSDFDYHLPKEMIAQRPLEERDQSKLMVLNRKKGSIEHHQFFELPELLDENTVLVFNESRVIPARIKFKLGNGKGEILLIKQVDSGPLDPSAAPSTRFARSGSGPPAIAVRRTGRDDKTGAVWECMVRPGEKLQAKTEVQIDPELSFYIKDVTDNGLRIIRFRCDDFNAWLKAHGHTPTPPYIKDYEGDAERYQTVYSKTEGSVAAPTAGFHFTERTFADLRAKGIQTEFITLHVGLGTFQPVKTEDITKHQLHSEWFSLEPEVAQRLNQAKYDGKKIVAVGTTSVRVLETCANDMGALDPQSGETDIFIFPGYRWKFVDQLITNFHVPKSTLLMLVSAFATPHPESDLDVKLAVEGIKFILEAYEQAKKGGYRFFSFGDAMWIY